MKNKKSNFFLILLILTIILTVITSLFLIYLKSNYKGEDVKNIWSKDCDIFEYAIYKMDQNGLIYVECQNTRYCRVNRDCSYLDIIDNNNSRIGKCFVSSCVAFCGSDPLFECR